ncbi:hypothetical protein [Lactococcus lactis]|uniref:Flagellar motility protein MotE (MotC chaperone) n=1 Tax=Lactococcus lactis TaxID=1358 RepID=A0AAW5TTV9_9LACT|nr:hypothetical protein [Lactococcus lactis]MCW2280430.1 flagellar motility protein MotE (MotC chaperone) [Lactococcus lactis]
MKLEELKDNIRKLEELNKAKYEFEVCISEIKDDEEVTYLHPHNYWCYVNTNKFKKLLQSELEQKEQEIAALKQLIGVD